MWIYVISRVRLAGWRAILWQGFNIGRYLQTFLPDSFIPAMLTGTIDFYLFIPLSVTLTLAGIHKVNEK